VHVKKTLPEQLVVQHKVLIIIDPNIVIWAGTQIRSIVLLSHAQHFKQTDASLRKNRSIWQKRRIWKKLTQSCCHAAEVDQ